MLDPEDLARRWVPGRGKPLVQLVARGPGNSTYRVRRDGLNYAMRLPRTPFAPLPVDAEAPWEQRVFEAAAAAHLSPPVSNADPASGILVTEWVRGRPWTQASAKDPAQTTRVAMLVRRIHALAPAPPHYARRPGDWIGHYRKRSRHAGSEYADESQRRLATIAGLPPLADVLCHSDLHRLNLVDSRAGLIVLDWEYAHYSDPFWDLAGWLSANDLEEPQRSLLLAGYLGRTPGKEHLLRVKCLMWLYDYVCLLWGEANARELSEAGAAAVASRAKVYAARLSAPP
jgi:aminoglycoside phosphotransferase (APT) family kinase protein